MDAKVGLKETLCTYNERRRVNLKFCLADFAHLIQKPSRRYCIFSVVRAEMKKLPQAPGSCKQNQPDHSFFFIRNFSQKQGFACTKQEFAPLVSGKLLRPCLF